MATITVVDVYGFEVTPGWGPERGVHLVLDILGTPAALLWGTLVHCLPL